jgi:drug/metabolite transporter (DMT)-like permease
MIMGLLSGIFFGAGTPFSKALLPGMNSFLMAGLLYLGASLAFLPFILRNGKRELASIRKSRNRFSIPGIVLFGGMLGPLFLMMGLRLASASSVSIWLNMELAATALLGMAFFREYLDRFAMAGIVMTLAAGIVITFQEGAGSPLAALFVVVACFCWALDNHLTALVDGASPESITFIKGFFAGSTNTIIGLSLDGIAVPPLTMAAAALIGVFSYGLSIVLYVTSAQQLGATRGQILFSTGPFWGILCAFIFLGEPMDAAVLGSMALLAMGIALTGIRRHEHPHVHRAVSHVHLHDHADGHHDHSHDGDERIAGPHTHLHEHAGVRHSHSHYPDLHHRHDHR